MMFFLAASFLVRGDRVFEIKEDHIDIGLCRFFKHLRLAAGDSKFAAIQASGGLFDGMKTHV